ncbi:MAG: FAD-dependent oxidoreductase [Flavobacteriales bacterium]|nr:FAD-dependent oxidoreductase [Flavobacteriales bacterium]
MKHVVIIGNGISGITAARHIRKQSDYRITIISAETDHFFSRTALMYIYMGHMKYEHTKPYEDWFWKKNRIELVREFVSTIDFDSKTLSYESGGTLKYDDLILAVGSKPNKFGWPGQNLNGVQGLYSYPDLVLMEKNTTDYKVNRAVIVGGGLIGVEMAEMLLTRGIEITFLVMESNFWGNVLPKEEGRVVERHLIKHHVDIKLNTELEEIIADENGRVKAIKTKNGEEVICEFVGLTAGVSPNVGFLKPSDLDVQRGICVNRYLETNQPDVYAIGDCAQNSEPAPGRRPMEQVWYTGRMMGETVARTICGKKTAYLPGQWFNSAKFFDIEYQTYGTVLPALGNGEEFFYWEDVSGEICVKIVYDKVTKEMKGTNIFGMRMRHEIWDRWLNEKRNIEHVLLHLKDANFDPEFYKTYEKQILNRYNEENGTSLVPLKRSWKRILVRN